MKAVCLGAAFCVALAALLGGGPAVAQMFGPEYTTCREQPRAPGVVACLVDRTKAWDARLARALRALPARMDPDQRAPLAEAQQAWLRYRNANCGFYAARDGSIRTLQAAECHRAMAEARAIEIEQAMTKE